MNKGLKIVLNLFIFLLVGGFIWYMVTSINKEETTYAVSYEDKTPFASPYEQADSFEIAEGINCFDASEGRLYVSVKDQIEVYSLNGNKENSFAVNADVRDIVADGNKLYVLYPTRIEVYSLNGELIHQWEACSELSDYCSLTVSGEYVFVTDAENKNICKYTSEGNFMKFIDSPRGFIIPSYAFDIVSKNDTIYCVNAGRHLVESYTKEGNFISAFGGPGGDTGFFAGCSNPSFITFNQEGELITSEKGNPRVSSFSRNGSFRQLLLNKKLLGGGNEAYEIKTIDNLLLVAGKNKITIFRKKDKML